MLENVQKMLFHSDVHWYKQNIKHFKQVHQVLPSNDLNWQGNTSSNCPMFQQNPS